MMGILILSWTIVIPFISFALKYNVIVSRKFSEIFFYYFSFSLLVIISKIDGK